MGEAAPRAASQDACPLTTRLSPLPRSRVAPHAEPDAAVLEAELRESWAPQAET